MFDFIDVLYNVLQLRKWIVFQKLYKFLLLVDFEKYLNDFFHNVLLIHFLVEWNKDRLIDLRIDETFIVIDINKDIIFLEAV